MEDILVWVDEYDNEIGSGPKLRTHELAQLHRAFSVFLFNPERTKMLLQRRAFGKYHSGGMWSNACCSHPRVGEDIAQAIHNRLQFELGLLLEESGVEMPVYCGHFIYRADFGPLSEHELDHVYACSVDISDVSLTGFNPEEIESLQWVELSVLERWMKEEPEAFSAWFMPAYRLVKENYLSASHGGG